MTTAIQTAGSSQLALVRNQYVARRNFLNFLGIRCRILTPDGQPVMFVHLKAFKLKEDITVYADQAQTQPLLSIKARSVIDFSAAYDVVDTTTDEKVGALRRKGWSSLVRDEWEVLDAADEVVGVLQEDSLLLALVRRVLSGLVPQNYTLTMGGQKVADVQGSWNPFVVKHTMDLSPDARGQVDRRLAIATSVLLMVIEGKQG
ncbi:MAG: hypothetical protein ACOCXM_02790 [Myxococcota bacterium]